MAYCPYSRISSKTSKIGNQTSVETVCHHLLKIFHFLYYRKSITTFYYYFDTTEYIKQYSSKKLENSRHPMSTPVSQYTAYCRKSWHITGICHYVERINTVFIKKDSSHM